MIYKRMMLCLLWPFISLSLHAQHHDVLTHGIRGDNPSNTRLINSLIDSLYAVGGGTIVFPPGDYLTGAIHLRSNIHLVIEGGAVLRFSQDFDDYPFVATRWAGVECMGFSPLIYANGASNVMISGMGTIDGNAYAWWQRHEEIMADPDKVEPRSRWERQLAELNRHADPGDLLEFFGKYWSSQFLRPPVIQFYNCTNVLIRDVTIVNSPFWTVHPVYCDGVTIDNITIDNPEGTHNTDGINPESSRNVRITNCLISVDDDCITIKSGRDRDGRRVGIPSENITISGCVLNRGYGGITIGSEMSGGVRNVVVTNCILNDLDWGIRIKTQRGRGGVIENIMANNLVINNNRIGISINARYTDLPPAIVSEKTPVIRRVRISDVIIDGTSRAAQVIGLEEMPIETVHLENMTINADEGFFIEDANNVFLNNIYMNLQTKNALRKRNATVFQYRVIEQP